ncbi:hypothetical protein C8Q77DRAFT_1125094 [Trametes polyzona]|nr:hypothetical protein C8Q77DRAFT_1125094 [Trametes polyzona]
MPQKLKDRLCLIWRFYGTNTKCLHERATQSCVERAVRTDHSQAQARAVVRLSLALCPRTREVSGRYGCHTRPQWTWTPSPPRHLGRSSSEYIFLSVSLPVRACALTSFTMSPAPLVDPVATSPDRSALSDAEAKSPVLPADDDEHKAKTLILCFDGTDSQFDGNNTNVVKFYSLLKKDDDNRQQLCYYQPGVGTYFNPGVVSPFFQWAAKILDEAFAWYLDAHVRGGYQFLMQNYNAGDRICLFGFSRGAYTARALAGMLHKIGLLPRDNPEQIPFAYKLYTKTDQDSLALAAGFKQTFCRTVEIEFVGVWETVASVGVLMSRTLPFTTANATIKKFRHALALDEHRVKFLPNFYHRNSQEASATDRDPDASASSSDEQAANTHTTESSGVASAGPSKLRRRSLFGKSPKLASKVEKTKLQQDHAKAQLRAGQSPTGSTTSSLVAQALGDRIPGGTDVLEVWFAGCHGDVGGGAVDDDVEVSLSDITLRWMVREVVLAQCGIAFDEAALVRANIPESIFRGEGFPLPAETTISRAPRGMHHRGFSPPDDAPADSQESGNGDTTVPQGKRQQEGSAGSGSEGGDALDARADALQPIHDALKKTPTWWLVEIIPTWYPWQDASGKWKTRFWFHLGRGRQVPVDVPPMIHGTVRMRMEDPTLQYTPRAQWKRGTEVFVS